MKILPVALILLSSIMMGDAPFEGPEQIPSIENLQDETRVADTPTLMEKRVRKAAVKVKTLSGHGSGTYVTYKGLHLVITAHHVTDSDVGQRHAWIVGQKNNDDELEKVSGTVVYSHPGNDISIILLDKKLKTRKAMSLKITATQSKPGTKTIYSGFPSQLNIMSITGEVSGYESIRNVDYYILHTMAWMGSSGSGIWDENGNLIAILVAITTESYRGNKVLIEDLVWATDARSIDLKAMINNACEIDSGHHVCGLARP